jgi:hypothetical protein
MAKEKIIPFEFVLDYLAPANPLTRPMFGCQAIYVGNKIVMALRDKKEGASDNGIWLATAVEHHESLRKDFPSLRSIKIFGTGESSWQVLPKKSNDFEESAIRACELILKNDPRIGKIPKPKSTKSVKRKTRRNGKKK